MNTIRLYLAAALVLLCAAAATVHAGADQFLGESAAAEVPAAPEDGVPRNWRITGVSGTGNLQEQPTTAAKINNTYPAGTIFDNLGCQRADGRIWCDIKQLAGGCATVVIKKPDGCTRAIFFRMGKPIGADTSEADGYLEFRATNENDLHLIHLGNERYEIPDAVVLGG